MRTANVPAQVTTVEDQVAGNLSMSQLALILAPFFVGGGIYALLPPDFEGATYKVVITVVVAVICAIAAVRFRGKILLLWAIVLLNYNLRPRHYVYNKNDTYLRDTPKPEQKEEPAKAEVRQEQELPANTLSVPDLVKLQDIVTDPKAKLRFLTDKKGGLRVHVTEVK